ncbi:probable LRR receptor-like serine/threonine-protein kinase IRK [Cynara cardunculus var. scolymus]|uniref:Leucine-rich repeat-containing protein n=1 Tax=Cynara cardunculus var. scolymus TaxID=59895 RepID=A0A103YJ76_CYNCS|nr:probable LRR receptor-like serine/threonine-protein kinase IRK [Cynara cardunculus var. scolymus]KVI10012.1 Leucine-rich repeat-containing protein [Cynara cardunculus var. scolymus]
MRKALGICIFLLLAPVIIVQSLNPTLDDDVLGLIVFKADLQDPDGKLASWNEDDDSPCKWKGIRCNPRSNRVSDLVLDGFGLSGRMGRGLMQLKFLSKLSLARNNLTGSIGVNLAQLANLRVIDLSENGLSGPVPPNFFDQCGSLRSISLANNRFSGQIPDSLVSCSALGALNFSSNQFSGLLPSGIWSLHGLRSLDLSDNLLKGEIPKDIEGLYNLREIKLRKNQFTGSVPDEIGACALLRSVDFSENLFSGLLPSTLQKLSLCNDLNFHSNQFTGEVTEWIGEMGSLQTVDLSKNMFSGAVPNAIGNIQSLKVLNISNNGFSGSLPASLINCKSIQSLDVSRNSLTGSLPTWVFQLGLQSVLFSENKLTGSIYGAVTSAIGISHENLQFLDISHNALSGEIPSDIGSFSSLRLLNISKNSLIGEIPEAMGKLKALDSLDLSENQLNGSIPSQIGGARNLKDLILARNSLSGSIPSSIGTCSSLTSLILSRNNLSGQVPVAMAKLTDLQFVDLSFNKLTGTLPKPLANLVHLVSFNVSHNQLQGELPAGAFFNTISPSSVSGNPTLCGAAVNKSCPAVLPKPIVLNPNSTGTDPDSIPPTLGHKRILLSISALIAIGAAAVIVIGIIFITVLNLRVRSSMSRSAAAVPLSGGDFSSSPTTDTNSGKLVMFSGDPDFSTGAHALLNKDCELGRGGFGAVYRTVLGDGRSVAIKKLTVSSLVKSQDDFEREVKKLGKIHHPNLVALEGYYWTPSLQLLIYEYVSGGNLYKHLHEEDEDGRRSSLTWNERFNIILGIAKSLAHLHQLNVIHYNLKSSNILIDGLGEPKVADFGLARLLPMLDRYVLSSKIQSALGYMAPEFACKTVKITEKCDVYGFGVLVLEIVTGRRPVEYMEDDVVILCDMVRGSLEEGRVDECIDERLQGKFPAEEAIPVMKLGLICTSQVPSNRPDMAEVINILGLIKCPSEGQEESG